MARGSHWPFSAGSSGPLSRSTVLSTMSFLPSTWQCGTSVTSLRRGTSQLSQITSHSHSLSPRCPTLGQLGSSATSLQYQSTPTTCVKHITGKSNLGVDALSRTIVNAVHLSESGMDFTAMAVAQREDKETAAYRTATSGLVLQDVEFGPSDTTLLCDVSTGQPKPIVPAAFRKAVFNGIHGL